MTRPTHSDRSDRPLDQKSSRLRSSSPRLPIQRFSASVAVATRLSVCWLSRANLAWIFGAAAVRASGKLVFESRVYFHSVGVHQRRFPADFSTRVRNHRCQFDLRLSLGSFGISLALEFMENRQLRNYKKKKRRDR